ncbi:glycosyltransferase family 2 protein [Beggiatoa leptomitoformis]|uniref:Glycosyltransferase n=1 Tax=Beggiatoa leptomitoformis TaxID=288004 RepID=A0A2N9Y9Z7_9GAMM|nr:glycosyltransferase family 2 protein [Beggiatoa leptomitoformis]AUI67280.1 glycosyltransferase [Beggiatoa leptomitoformis]QGX03585.1 glycosyltransferase [Beggiatoa leptomitoformis]
MAESNLIPLSVLIPTKNEERNIVACINSVAWADEIVVFDSYSDDQTIPLAESLDAKIVQRRFDNFSTHKNWAMENINFKHKWLLIVDADERITEELRIEIQTLFEQQPECDGYYIARKNYFWNTWVKRGGRFPDWQLRLLKVGYGHYEQRIVHEHMLLQGKAGFLKHALINYDYKGIDRYFDRQNTYSSMEAVEVFNMLYGTVNAQQIKPSLFAKGPERNRFLKNIAYRYLPFRPLIKFIWMYFIKLGFLDGKIGFRYSVLQMFYEYQVSLKLEELQDPDSPIAKKYQAYLQPTTQQPTKKG